MYITLYTFINLVNNQHNTHLLTIHFYNLRVLNHFRKLESAQQKRTFPFPNFFSTIHTRQTHTLDQ